MVPGRAARRHRSVTGLDGLLKRTVDVVIACVSLILLAPLMGLIAAAILIADRRPVFYRQVRVGFEGKRFTILKFRTMSTDAEAENGPVWSVPNDPRATHLGGILRRTGFDELPQLFNVLSGDMSLVGPRPERPVFVEAFRRDYRRYDERHTVRPGLTGYAQVHGWRGSTDLGRRLDHDLYYVRSWSLALDLYILLLTPFRGWSQRTRNGIPT